MAYGWKTASAGQWGVLTTDTIDNALPGYTKSPGNENICSPWSGGVLAGDIFAVKGGGHTDGWVNGWYALDLSSDSPTWSALANSQSNSTNTVYNDGNGIWADDAPSSNHTYGNLVYDSVNNRLVQFGLPAIWSTNADSFRYLIAYDLDTSAYLITSGTPDLTNIPTLSGSIEGCTIHHPTNGKSAYFGTAADGIDIYDFATDTHTEKVVDITSMEDQVSVAYDPVRDRVVFCGDGNLWTIEGLFELDLPCTLVSITDSGVAGGQALVNASAPGFIYIPEIDRYVGWNGGQALYALHPETWEWTALSVSGSTPTSAQTNGTYGRFQYHATTGTLIVVNDIDESSYYFVLDTTGYSAKQHSSTVGFGSQAVFASGGWTNAANLLANDTNYATPSGSGAKHRLYAQSSSPSIPSNATNICCQLYYRSVYDTYPDGGCTTAAQISIDGSTPSTQLQGLATQYSGAKESHSFGDSAEDWGLTIDYTDANGSTFSGIIQLYSDDGYPEETAVEWVGRRWYWDEPSAINLIVADSSQSSSVDTTLLTQTHQLSLNDSLHSATAENASLTQTHQLSVNAANHSLISDNVDLSTVTLLSVNQSDHSVAVDSIQITQTHQISVSDALHSATAENASLTQTHQLAAADSQHAGTADNVSLTQIHVLTVNESDHSVSVESVEISQTHILAVQESLHTLLSDNIDLETGVVLIVSSANHSLSSDAPDLNQTHILSVLDALHGFSSDSVSLTQTHVLVVSDALHSLLTDPVVLGLVDSISRSAILAMKINQPKRSIETGPVRTMTVSGQTEMTIH